MSSPSSSHPRRLSIIHGPSSPPLLRLTFGDVLRKRCRKHPDKVALISQHQNETLSYADLHQRSDDLAAGLLAAGIGKGDRVAVLLGNRSEYVDIFFACAKVGALVTLLNFAYTPVELKLALAATGAKLLFTTLASGRYDYVDVLSGLETDIPTLQGIVILPTITGPRRSIKPSSFFRLYTDFLQRGRRKEVDLTAIGRGISCMDILNLQFTSGSTGAPKAAALTHSGIVNSARYISLQMKISNNDKIVIPLPLFHAFGLIIGLCAAFVAGASAVLPSEYFDSAATLEAVEKYRCQGLYGVTTMFIDMMSHPNFASTDRSCLRFGVMAGSAMPEELLTRVMTKFPIPQLFTNWGMTELSSIATMTTTADPFDKRMKTAGRLLPNFTAKIVAPNTGTVLPWGARGEIVVAGFGVMHSYFNDKARTAQALKQHVEDLQPGEAGPDSAGQLRVWMHTGDEGYLDGDGYFVITGRIKDLIIRGGENIAPLEIEARLFVHPAVKQAAVFGLPSARYGEEVAALLELADGVAWPQRPRDPELRAWVRQTLARYKTPVRIWWLGDARHGVPGEWPKTANGKLRKKDIRLIGEALMKREAGSETVPIRPSL